MADSLREADGTRLPRSRPSFGHHVVVIDITESAGEVGQRHRGDPMRYALRLLMQQAVEERATGQAEVSGPRVQHREVVGRNVPDQHIGHGVPFFDHANHGSAPPPQPDGDNRSTPISMPAMATDPTPRVEVPRVRRVTGAFEAHELAERVMDPERATPIVCLTARHREHESFVPVDPVVEIVGDGCEVWVLTRQEDTWALSAELPERFDVYGGAARLWMPVPDRDRIDVHAHPLVLVHNNDRPEDVLRRLTEHVRRLVRPPGPAVGTTVTGRVESVEADRAHIRLLGGAAAVCFCGEMARGPIYDAREALEVGMAVTGEVVAPAAPGRDTRITLKPFAPDPWKRTAAVYRPGMIVEGVVIDLFHYGALVEIMPGAAGIVQLVELAEPMPRSPDEVVARDDRVVVKILRMDPGARRAVLSMVEVPRDAVAEPPASVYPDGPPWLGALDDDEPHRQAASEAARAEPSTETTPPSPTPTADVAAPAPAVRVEPTIGPAPSPTPPVEAETEVPATPSPADPPVAPPATTDAATDRAGGVPSDLTTEIAHAETAADRLTAELARADDVIGLLEHRAFDLTERLRHDIVEAEGRIARLAEIGSRGDDGATVDQLAVVEDLRERLASAEADRRALLEERRGALEEARSARAEADLRRSEVDVLRAQLDDVDRGDPAARFLRELRHTWSTLNVTDDDRTRYPFREPALGTRFLESLDRVQGISRERILEVCAHVVSNRAYDIAGLEVHQLRTSAAGGTPQRTRADGATAWRASLQVKTPSARRLHYWLLTDGTIELAQINTHDDMSIS